MKFRRYDKTWVDWDKDFDFYGSLAEEVGCVRRAAKLLYWNVIYGANDLRLGAAAAEIKLEDISAEDGHTYSIAGEWLREIVAHYIIERVRILDKLGQINYVIPVDN
jgi:hypothetical protein